MEKYDCFGNFYESEKDLIEGFSYHTYKDRYCVDSNPYLYKRVNIDKRDILKKNNCNDCWCKDKDKFKKLDNKHKYIYCKKGKNFNKTIKNKLEEMNNKINKYNKILELKKKLEKYNNDFILINDIENNKVSEVSDEKILPLVKNYALLKNEEELLENNLIKKKSEISIEIDKLVEKEEKDEEEDIDKELKDIESSNLKELNKIRKKSNDLIEEMSKLKLEEQEKTMNIIRIREELDSDLEEINKLKKIFTDNKNNLMEAKNLLHTCKNKTEELINCPTYNILFFSILALMILYCISIYSIYGDRLF